MRRNISRVLALLAPAVVYCAGPVQGQTSQYSSPSDSYYSGNADGRYFTVADGKDGKEAAPGDLTAGAPCDSCCEDDCCDDCLDPVCEDCPRSNLVLWSGFASWRGFSEGSWQNNNGALTGVNWGAPLGGLEEYGIGAQLGASYGVYDWNGRASSATENNDSQTQLFVTAGLFRRANCDSPWSGGVAYDWMVNDNFSVFSTEPFLGQWRGQLGYALDACNEIGAWGTLRDRGDTQTVAGVPVSYRAVEQLNAFWHHKWEAGADTWVWVGIPDDDKLGTAGGSLGDFLVGGSITAPMNDRWAVYADFQYMDPSASPGVAATLQDSWYISAGVAFYPSGNARNGRTVAGNCWAPLMPVANNGNFITDSSLNF